MAQPKTKRPTVHITPATRCDIPALARAYLRAFANSPLLPIFSPQYVDISSGELFRIGLPIEINRFEQEIVGPNISMKATVSKINERGETVEVIIGYASWISPDGPRKQTLWEWFLSNIFYPFFKPIPIPEGVPPLKEMFEAQKEQVFGKGAIWEGKRFWHLRLLFVDPDWQGFGISSALLQWGFYKARGIQWDYPFTEPKDFKSYRPSLEKSAGYMQKSQG
ncbi:hypothetical protein Clacol_000796 [Clathrus columnatus]|uniref:N-acetyltransferase domain-containing protein n=1 Tax=Clathrus columnatus TaxID=1419009 RepID=A0AAV4ZZE4_9AGAM|nr:hypothetical protein Clacol_000796 [Clathrus columnatus]